MPKRNKAVVGRKPGRTKGGTFKKGNNLAKTAPEKLSRGEAQFSGRALALRTLDEMIVRAGNRDKLARALQKEFDKDQFRFFQQVIVPLIPKESLVRVDNRTLAGFHIVFTDLTQGDDDGSGSIGSTEPRGRQEQDGGSDRDLELPADEQPQ